MNNRYDDVSEFMLKFEFIHEDDDLIPHLISHEEFLFRIIAIHEELNELMVAYMKGDLAGITDALVDITYFVYGTSILMDLPLEKAWDLVHQANMKKQLAPANHDHKRGWNKDIIKPFSWKAPDIESLFK
jgi:predicted HAD superfamily Cof-like phosphohydrolase